MTMPESFTCLDLSISMPGLSSSNVPSSGDGGIKDLDINQIPSGGEDDCMEEDDYESLNSGGGGGGGDPPRKKLRLTKEQSRLLEESFRQNHTLNPRQKEVLAMQLKLKQRQVEVWFQNRRARSKLKQTEMECEYLKRWYGSLTEQNRRLHKELQELRAMKVGPPTAIASDNGSLRSASTFTLCPRCERVSTVGNGRGGPSASTTTSASPTLSAKGPIFRHRRHPSAAC